MHSFLMVVLLLATPAAHVDTAPPQARPAAAPDDTAGYFFLLGRHLEGEGQVPEAITALERAIALMPESAELYAELAALYGRQNRAADALVSAEAALQRDSLNREANRVLGSVYAALSGQNRPLRAGDDPSQYGARAIAALVLARREGIVDVNIELMLGRLYLESGDAQSALPSLRRVVDDQPGYPEAAMLLAAAQERAGHADDAIGTLEALLLATPSFFNGRLRLAELYEQEHRFREAAAAYAGAQAEHAGANLTSRQAAALINAGDPSAARALLQDALARTPASPDSGLLYWLAQAQRQLKDLDGATRTASTLEAASPGDPRTSYLKAQLLQDQGRTTEAIAVFQALMKRVPDEASFVYEYASLLEKSGRAADAERALRDLLVRDPLDGTALNALGYMFAERGERLDEAVALLQRALKIEPANPSFLDSLGWAYFRQGRFDLAEAPLTEAAAKLPSSSAVQDHLGDLRFKQLRYVDAAAAWERSLASDGDSIVRATVEKKLRDVRERLRK